MIGGRFGSPRRDRNGHPSWRITSRVTCCLALLLCASTGFAIDGKKVATNLAQKAAQAFEAGEMDQAAEWYHEAYRSDPAEPNFLYGAARAEQAGHNREAAEEDFRKFITLEGADPARVIKAKAYLSELIEQRGEAKAKSAAKAVASGDLVLGAAAYLEAYRLCPDRHLWLFKAAMAEREALNGAAAIEHLQAYLKVAPATAEERPTAVLILKSLQTPPKPVEPVAKPAEAVTPTEAVAKPLVVAKPVEIAPKPAVTPAAATPAPIAPPPAAPAPAAVAPPAAPAPPPPVAKPAEPDAAPPAVRPGKSRVFRSEPAAPTEPPNERLNMRRGSVSKPVTAPVAPAVAVEVPVSEAHAGGSGGRVAAIVIFSLVALGGGVGMYLGNESIKELDRNLAQTNSAGKIIGISPDEAAKKLRTANIYSVGGEIAVGVGLGGVLLASIWPRSDPSGHAWAAPVGDGMTVGWSGTW